jgi:hypothetical protein
MKGSTAQWQALDMLAQLWARRGDGARAARLLACADAMYRLRRFVRKPHVARARDMLLATLAGALPADMLARALREGEGLSEDEAVALAMALP